MFLWQRDGNVCCGVRSRNEGVNVYCCRLRSTNNTSESAPCFFFYLNFFLNNKAIVFLVLTLAIKMDLKI